MADKKTVLIVDDHPIFREGLKTLISHGSCYQIAGEAANAKEALQQALNLKPDIITVDLSLPDQNGIELIKDLIKHLPKIRILVVSTHSRSEYITSAFKAGATGYVVKDAAAENLLSALDALLKGDYFIDSSVSVHLIKEMARKDSTKVSVSEPKYNSLTLREQEIMALLAEGKSVKEIADKLCISPKTVKNHRANIYAKIECSSIVDLVKYAARLGIIDVDLWK